MVSGARLRPSMVVLSALAAGCRPQGVSVAVSQDAGVAVAAAVAAEPLDDLRESARTLLETNCGDCHVRGSPKALPRALAVYDLEQLDWSRRMTDDQLRDADGRLHQPTVPTPGEDELRQVRASPEELERFHAYVVGEVARRKEAPAAR